MLDVGRLRKVLLTTRFMIGALLFCSFHFLWRKHVEISSETLSNSDASTFLPPKTRPISTDSTNRHNTSTTFVPWHPNITGQIWTRYDLRRLWKLDPVRSPVMPTCQLVRIRVVLFNHRRKNISFREGPTSAISDEVLNICMDGFDRSPYFNVIDATVVPDFNKEPEFRLREAEDIVWVVDMRRIMYEAPYSIDEQTLKLVESTLQWQQQELTTEKRPSLRVVFVDYRDFVTTPLCSDARVKLIQLLGEDNVRFVVRNVINRRQWESTTNWSRSNHVGIPPQLLGNCSNFVRATYTVRSDHVEAIKRLFPRFLPDNTTSYSPVDTIRSVDAAHFWTINHREVDSKLRNVVTEVVLSLNGTVIGDRTIRTVGSTVSEQRSVGRITVSDRYIEGLLTSKIVVVAQRDRYEDHYRLFEAFGGGAMVMSDVMLSLPDGLVDGESIVMYRSREHLRELLLYYLHPNQDWKRLEIARRGFAIAMGQHRSFHLMERIFFGNNLTAS